MTDVIERPDTTFVRWIARVFYRSENGLVDVQHDMEELEELQDLVERGPNWDTIEKIEIRRAVPSQDLITIEEARQL
ncbi:MAG: hypothetical protein ABF979_15355 [Gluconobacter sp.]|uniref:hypothetical protein n=1 Tax=Gluconobacter sp. TaxID=1876758 RepID=UPI0039E93136